MKNKILTLVLILTSGFVFAQVNTNKNQESKIKYLDKSILKSDTKKTETSKPIVAEETEPVIIQRLEYKSEENTSTQKEIISEDPIPAESKEKEIEPAKTIDEQIAIQDSYINALNTKIESVKNNPEQDKKAKENGWYEQMEKNKAESLRKKEELIKLKK
jgi:CRISPR/Cas system CMR subunit Cmr4 (Cas7 group RAMP superfamily)